MSVVVKLIVGGWITTLSMVALCALKESSGLPNASGPGASRFEAPASAVLPSEESL